MHFLVLFDFAFLFSFKQLRHFAWMFISSYTLLTDEHSLATYVVDQRWRGNWKSVEDGATDRDVVPWLAYCPYTIIYFMKTVMYIWCTMLYRVNTEGWPSSSKTINARKAFEVPDLHLDPGFQLTRNSFIIKAQCVPWTTVKARFFLHSFPHGVIWKVYLCWIIYCSTFRLLTLSKVPWSGQCALHMNVRYMYVRVYVMALYRFDRMKIERQNVYQRRCLLRR